MSLVRVENLKKYFKVSGGWLHAVDGVTFSLDEGKTLGVVGESGCGKSTLGRTIVHLLESTGGEIFFDEQNITDLNNKAVKELRKDMQIIFQDPFSSLNPKMTVSQCIAEPLRCFKTMSNDMIMQRVAELMDMVGIARRLANSYPHELDGGRRQRIGIARALSLDPKFIVCDEPVSALDVSIQAQILNLMQDLQESLGLTYMFITHDLSVVKHISDHILVMYLGEMVEMCEAKELFSNTCHPYTKALLSAIPVPDIDYASERILLRGEISSPVNPGPGCRFAPRCDYATPACFEKHPAFTEVTPGHFVSCHLYEKSGAASVS